MAKLSAHGTELVRLFNRRTGSLLAFMSDGFILRKKLASGGWRQWRRFKDRALTPEQIIFKATHRWVEIDKGLEPAKGIHQPSLETMERWAMDGVAEATDGCRVEPDGRCPHGFFSWLILAGII